MFSQFVEIVSDASGWAHGIVFLLALLDVLAPVVPSEASVITAGVVAAAGGISLPLIITAAACGAFLGDNVAFLLGRRFGPRAKEAFLYGQKARKSMRWAETQLAERGGELIAVARFIPGGRTAVTLSAGTLGFPWKRFGSVRRSRGAHVGSVHFAARLLRRAFEGAVWKGLLLALGIAFAVAGLIEIARWYLRRRQAGRTRAT